MGRKEQYMPRVRRDTAWEKNTEEHNALVGVWGARTEAAGEHWKSPWDPVEVLWEGCAGQEDQPSGKMLPPDGLLVRRRMVPMPPAREGSGWGAGGCPAMLIRVQGGIHCC